MAVDVAAALAEGDPAEGDDMVTTSQRTSADRKEGAHEDVGVATEATSWCGRRRAGGDGSSGGGAEMCTPNRKRRHRRGRL